MVGEQRPPRLLLALVSSPLVASLCIRRPLLRVWVGRGEHKVTDLA